MTEIRTISALSNVKLHRICGTEDVGSFIRPQQRNYASHVKRMSHERNNLYLMRIVERPAKTITDQVICSENVTLDQFCNLSIGRRF